MTNEIVTELKHLVDNQGNTLIGYRESHREEFLAIVNKAGEVHKIGTLHKEGLAKVLVVRKLEREMHRKTKSWGVEKVVFSNVDKLKIITEIATYIIDSNVALLNAMSFDYSNNTHFTKVYIPVYLFGKIYNEPSIGPLIEQFGLDWFTQLKPEFFKPYMAELSSFLKQERLARKVYPEHTSVFNAMKLTPFDEVKVVILGHSPYPGKHADGIAFSSNDEDVLPKELVSIFAEVEQDVYDGFYLGFSTDLTRLAVQGVLLLNIILTTTDKGDQSHAGVGWEIFTTNVIHLLTTKKKNLVYMLWGEDAQLYSEMIDPKENLVLTSGYPNGRTDSGFLGNGHFSKANEYLTKIYGKQAKIAW